MTIAVDLGRKENKQTKMWFAVVWWWFGANMAGQRNKMLLNFFFNY